MIKTIKVKKTKDLSELIAYISVSGIKDANFVSNYENIVSVDHSGQITTAGKFYNDTFTVEVEEEITEYTEFEAFVVITDKGTIKSINNYHNMRSVRGLLENYEVEQKVYALIDNNLELIWEAE